MARREEGYFSASDNLRLYFESAWPDGTPKAHLAVIHGYANHLGRYREVIDGLVSEGFAVHAFDYRGHGKAAGRRGHVTLWEEYLSDLENFWKRVRQAAGDQKVFMLAHSHGALMAIQWLGREARPGLTGLVLSAPWLKLGMTPPALKVLASKAVGLVLPWIPIRNEITPKDLSRDEVVQQSAKADPLYNKNVTPGWFNVATAAQLVALKKGNAIKVPTLMVCGSADIVSSTPTNKEFFSTIAAADKTYKEYPGMRHEVLNEIGRQEVHRDISNWLSKHL